MALQHPVESFPRVKHRVPTGLPPFLRVPPRCFCPPRRSPLSPKPSMLALASSYEARRMGKSGRAACVLAPTLTQWETSRGRERDTGIKRTVGADVRQKHGDASGLEHDGATKSRRTTVGNKGSDAMGKLGDMVRDVGNGAGRTESSMRREPIDIGTSAVQRPATRRRRRTRGEVVPLTPTAFPRGSQRRPLARPPSPPAHWGAAAAPPNLHRCHLLAGARLLACRVGSYRLAACVATDLPQTLRVKSR